MQCNCRIACLIYLLIVTPPPSSLLSSSFFLSVSVTSTQNSIFLISKFQSSLFICRIFDTCCHCVNSVRIFFDCLMILFSLCFTLSLSVDHRIDEINLRDRLLLPLCVHRRVQNGMNSLPLFDFFAHRSILCSFFFA